MVCLVWHFAKLGILTTILPVLLESIALKKIGYRCMKVNGVYWHETRLAARKLMAYIGMKLGLLQES